MTTTIIILVYFPILQPDKQKRPVCPLYHVNSPVVNQEPEQSRIYIFVQVWALSAEGRKTTQLEAPN